MFRFGKTILPLLAVAVSATAFADPPPRVEAQKERREAEREWRKDQREAQKEQREDHREWLKEQRERQKELRQARREAAKDGWYDGDDWRSYDGDWRYRDSGYQAIVTYAPPRPYIPPPEFRAVVYEPGMRLPSPYYGETYYIEHHHYGLPPPPPHHHWVRVDDDVVLVAIASGLVADFVYDLFD